MSSYTQCKVYRMTHRATPGLTGVNSPFNSPYGTFVLGICHHVGVVKRVISTAFLIYLNYYNYRLNKS